MNWLLASFHIPMNCVGFFFWSGKSNEQGITTQDPGKPLIKGGTLIVQLLVSVWITAIRPENNVIKMGNSLKTHLSGLQLHSVSFVVVWCLTFQVKVQKTQSPFERCHILLSEWDLPIKWHIFRLLLFIFLGTFINITQIIYPWRFLFIQVILTYNALAGYPAPYPNINQVLASTLKPSLKEKIMYYILIFSFLL